MLLLCRGGGSGGFYFRDAQLKKACRPRCTRSCTLLQNASSQHSDVARGGIASAVAERGGRC